MYRTYLLTCSCTIIYKKSCDEYEIMEFNPCKRHEKEKDLVYFYEYSSPDFITGLLTGNEGKYTGVYSEILVDNVLS